MFRACGGSGVSRAVKPGYSRSGAVGSRGIDAAATPVGSLAHTPRQSALSAFRNRLLVHWQHDDGDARAVLRALLVGDTRSMTSTLWRDLRHLGVVHVVVISGLHIGLLAALCLWSLPGMAHREDWGPRGLVAPILGTLVTGAIPYWWVDCPWYGRI